MLNYNILPAQKLTIIGNGFDLAVGAKTSYENFYECLKSCFTSASIEDFKKIYASEDNKGFVDSFIKIISENKDNYFINYFLNYEKIFGNWVSFEKELTRIIVSMDELISRLNDSNVLAIETYFNDIEIYVKIADKFNILSVLNVFPDNKFFWVNMSIQFTSTKEEALLFGLKERNYSNRYEILKSIEDFTKEFPLGLYDDLKIFSDLFSVYLGIVNHCVDINSNANFLLDSNYYINYNYTTYLERVVRKNRDDIEVLYINGLAENFNCAPREKIVFGIDSKTSFSNGEFEVFTKRIQRTIKNTDVNNLTEFLDRDFEDIHILGHSLSLADYDSLHFILTKCEKNEKPNIRVYYYDSKARIDLTINISNILGRDKFDEYQREGKLIFVESKEAWGNGRPYNFK